MTGKKTAPERSRAAFKTRILLVEDDANLGEVIKDLLEIKGHEVDLCRDGEAALRAFRTGSFDLCLIDIMLPKMDGFALARAVRETDRRVPLIFLTAKAMKEDRIEGFRIGGDDYVTKPFHTEELLLRIEAVLRRTRSPSGSGEDEPVMSIGNYVFDPKTRTLELKGSRRNLTQKEADLLRVLAGNMNDVLDRDKVLRAVWGSEGYFVARSMDVYISKLRKHLADDPRVEIQNVHGRGFRLIVRSITPG
jgi:two-component system, OmpR family, response regulator